MREGQAIGFEPRVMLITGGAGFIGSNFVHFVLERYSAIKVINLDAMTYAADKNNLAGLEKNERHVFVEGDICDDRLLRRLFSEYAVDTIVHFAAESHVDRSISGPEAFVVANVLGTYKLLETARRYWAEAGVYDASRVRFHHISTDEVYGTLQETDPAFTENSRYLPNSPYSASKASSDHLVRAYFHTYGLPVTTSNCSNNYGPRQHREKFIPTIIESCMKSKPIPVYGDGRNIRDWLYVGDHCSAVDQVIRQGELGSTYNIGGGAEMRNLDVVRHVCNVMDKIRPSGAPHDRLIEFIKDRPGHDWRYAIDYSRIKTDLGWNPACDFDEGLTRTVEWYLE